jgi:hypothetical protein
MAAPGQSFTQSLLLDEKPETLMQSFVTAAAGANGYTLNTAGPNSLVLTRKFLPTWAIVVAIIGAFFLLLGLLFLLVRTTETLTVTLAETDGGTRVTISGLATPEMMARLNAVIGGTKTVSAASASS